MSPLLYNCLKVFFCRILDVTLGSMRTVLVVRGKTLVAAITGFFEVFLWYVVVRDALSFDGPVIPVAISYAAGYASGTFIGGTLAAKLVRGHINVSVITSHRDDAIPAALRNAGFGITVMKANSSDYGDKKYYILSEMSQTRLEDFERLVKSMDENAFILVQETKSYIGGYRRKGK